MRSVARSRFRFAALAPILACAFGCVDDLAPDASSGPDWESGAGSETSTGTDTDTDGDSEACEFDLVEAVGSAGIRTHLQVLQDIADQHDGNRQAGHSGFDASADYVIELMTDAGYEVEAWSFEFDAFEVQSDGELAQVQPQAVPYSYDEVFQEALWTPSGESTAAVRAIDLDLGLGNMATSGCEAEDFAGFDSGDIALIQRGACSFAIKAQLAQEAGASGVLIFNQGDTESRTGLFGGTLGSGNELEIPVLMADYQTGESLADLADNDVLVVQMRTDTMVSTRETVNVFAETPGGTQDAVVMLGAHLDSVPDGPGINDNGSGSALLMEVARQFGGCNPTHKVRFAWWGAEEWGLIGSSQWVASLDESELDRIALYMNFDMVASPNFVRGVHDGDGSSNDDVPEGSAPIEAAFLEFFEARDLPVVEFGYSGRSDYEPFRKAGIPVGGLATGANGIKTDDEVQTFGGQSGEQHDPCYHLACDDVDNPDASVHEENAKAVAYVLERVAASFPAAAPERAAGHASVDAPLTGAHACGHQTVVAR